MTVDHWDTPRVPAEDPDCPAVAETFAVVTKCPHLSIEHEMMDRGRAERLESDVKCWRLNIEQKCSIAGVKWPLLILSTENAAYKLR